MSDASYNLINPWRQRWNYTLKSQLLYATTISRVQTIKHESRRTRDTGRIEDSQLRQAVARNPNTPQAELENLWIDDPLAVLDNPVTQLNTLMEGTSAAEAAGIVQVAFARP